MINGDVAALLLVAVLVVAYYAAGRERD